MTVKALDVITDALSLVGFTSCGEAPEAEASALAVRTLNRMLLEWSTKSVYSPAQYDQSCPSNGTASYLLGDVDGGPTPDISTSPKAIMQVTIEQGIVVWPTSLGTLADWHKIMPKTIQGVPSSAFWDYQQGQSRLYLWPIPVSNMTVRIVGIQDIATIRNAQSEILLPADYEEALVYNLAKRLMPHFPPSADANPKALEEIIFIANSSLSGIKRRNANMREMRVLSDFPGVGNAGGGNDGYLNWRGRAV